MKLWLVVSSAWSVQVDVVRAEDEAGARRVACSYPEATVTELSPEGGEQVLWAYENCPDTGE